MFRPARCWKGSRRHRFLLRNRHGVKECLDRRLTEAPAPLDGPRLIVLVNPDIEIGLQLVDETIHLFAELETVKLIEHGLVGSARRYRWSAGSWS